MSRRGRFPLPSLLLAAAVILAAAGPGWAHPAVTGLSVESPLPAVMVDSPAPPGPPPLAGTPQPSGVPWLLLASSLIVVAALWGRPWPIALVLALALAVFGFEDALHSVHHGFDKEAAKSCVIAAASAQLSATTVNPVAQADLVPPPGEKQVPECTVTRPLVRFLHPDQGRAPPA